MQKSKGNFVSSGFSVQNIELLKITVWPAVVRFVYIQQGPQHSDITIFFTGSAGTQVKNHWFWAKFSLCKTTHLYSLQDFCTWIYILIWIFLYPLHCVLAHNATLIKKNAIYISLEAISCCPTVLYHCIHSPMSFYGQNWKTHCNCPTRWSH